MVNIWEGCHDSIDSVLSRRPSTTTKRSKSRHRTPAVMIKSRVWVCYFSPRPHPTTTPHTHTRTHPHPHPHPPTPSSFQKPNELHYTYVIESILANHYNAMLRSRGRNRCYSQKLGNTMLWPVLRFGHILMPSTVFPLLFLVLLFPLPSHSLTFSLSSWSEIHPGDSTTFACRIYLCVHLLSSASPLSTSRFVVFCVLSVIS